MKRLSIVILAVLLALTTVLSASCAAPPEENAGNGNNVGNGGSAEGTDESTEPPEETEPESTADEGTEKEEESALPEDSDSSNEGTDSEDATEPDDTGADVPPETELVAPPETEPVAPPETEPVAPPETEPVDEKYLEAIEALTVLDEDTKKAIDEAMGHEITWLDYERIVSNRGRTVQYCCYGEYNGCIVFFKRTPLALHSTIKIADFEFGHPMCFHLLGFYEGVIYTLEEAYNMGLVTYEDLETIAKNHSIFSPLY